MPRVRYEPGTDVMKQVPREEGAAPTSVADFTDIQDPTELARKKALKAALRSKDSTIKLRQLGLTVGSPSAKDAWGSRSHKWDRALESYQHTRKRWPTDEDSLDEMKEAERKAMSLGVNLPTMSPESRGMLGP